MSPRPVDGLDAAFLALETPTSRLHVAAVVVLDPPEGTRSLFSPSTRFAQIRRTVAERLHLVPVLRQRAVRVPLGLYHPVWADDPDFDLDDHVRAAALPEPGGTAELDRLVGEILTRPLDPDRPLWELVVVEGLAGGRTALVAKLHHAIVDGVSGIALLAAFLDAGPRARSVPPPEPWDPEPLPGAGELLRHAASGLARHPGTVRAVLDRSVEAVADVGAHNEELRRAGDRPPPAPFSAPRTRLNGTVSGRRRFAAAGVPLADLRLVRRVFGGTVNDVILAAVAGALRRYLDERGGVPDEPLVALVPVSSRRRTATADAHNQVSAMLVSLATDLEDPVERFAAVAAATPLSKAQERLMGSHLLHDGAAAAVPALAGRLARWTAGLSLFDRVPPLFNVTVSSVPGPDQALWCAGARAAAVYPVGPVSDGAGLNVTALTYLDQVWFGLCACRRLVPDPGVLAALLDDACAELTLAAAEAAGAAG